MRILYGPPTRIYSRTYWAVFGTILKGMARERRISKVIEVTDHKEVNMLNEEVQQLTASRRTQMSLLEKHICRSIEQCLSEERTEENID